MTEAAKHEAWADYAEVLLDEETAAFFAARLPEAKAKAAGGDSESPPSKKRKKQAADSGASEVIKLRVACLDGAAAGAGARGEAGDRAGEQRERAR